ncbi:Histidinol dehydrogenase [Methanimicrococcus sp. At1]|uniref:Histidinol dehydrogenase n=1 Tax=Methanimicrococcus hacksteinii TaxID=3028293 RepID=A0ABU3VP51_9EURY|nr:histidinol dehydrogenase [Methanimicrococcus sp. At1]MDV0445192.1 Histidinol dehydrogenase [Methanimicrococcus sp. At1]
MICKKITELSGSESDQLLSRGKGLTDVGSAVDAILENVQKNGDQAILAYAKQFDKAELSTLEVTPDEVEEAIASLDSNLLKHLRQAAENIRRFHAAQLPKEIWYIEDTPGIVLGQKTIPLERVGCYVPGGRASYPSTVLMTALPAKVAGVSEVIVCTPPRADGTVHPLTLAACKIAGADKVFKTGGAQAIAGMAYGTKSIPSVDKIVGPGNVFVTYAKMKIRDYAEIDFPAGPSEVLIIADDFANPKMTAADILAQAEHDPNSVSILVTPSEKLAKAVLEEIEKQSETAQRKEIIEASLKNSAVLIAENMQECIDFSNKFGPEHLQIMTDPEVEDTVLNQIQNAGSVFIGNYAPVPAGDYASGTNHVLPTSGYVRMYSGLNTAHFLKSFTIQRISKEGLSEIKDAVIDLAETEGLFEHAEAIRKRFEE